MSSANGNKRKSDFLGMPHGTAANRLRKMVILHLAQQLGQDLCFRCGTKIENVEEFSIEHKEKWLGVSVELFWNLDNIAFSHLKCNTDNADRTNFWSSGGRAGRKQGPDGSAWCAGHKKFIPVEEFSIQQTRWNGLENYCRACRSRRRSKNLH